MLNLTIQHFIHLTRPQRYALHEGIQLVVVGVSVPVWFMQKNTSEPAREVFCKYYLSNGREDRPIRILDDGYDICLPYRKGKKLLNDKGKPLSNEEWRELNFTNPDKLDALYHRHVTEVSSAQLLDPPDGIKYMAYREHDKVKYEESELVIVHYVNLLDVEQLTESQIY